MSKAKLRPAPSSARYPTLAEVALSRRAFLGGLGVAAAAASLQACGFGGGDMASPDLWRNAAVDAGPAGLDGAPDTGGMAPDARPKPVVDHSPIDPGDPHQPDGGEQPLVPDAGPASTDGVPDTSN